MSFVADGKVDGVEDAETFTTIAPNDGSKVRPDITCFNCNNKGHFADKCPKEKKKTKDDQEDVVALNMTEECDEDGEF
eukprot:8755514-Ditylum_brightwellii.AAC.1